MTNIVQSILFSKPQWSIRKAQTWLRKHKFKGLEVDEKPNHLRFRQVEPQELYRQGMHLRTMILPSGIEIIIAFSEKSRK